MSATATRMPPESASLMRKRRGNAGSKGAQRPGHTKQTVEGASTVQHRYSRTAAVFPRATNALRAAGALLCAAVLLSAPAHADVAYIIDEIRVPLRETPCATCAVVQQGLKSGDQVKALEAGDGWTRVETSEHIVGWLPSRYLSAQPVAREQLAALRDENQRLQAENQALRQGGQPAPASNAAPDSAIAAQNSMTTGEAEDLRGQNQALLTRNKMLQAEIDVLHATKEDLQSNDVQRWFVFGGLLVALGALLGTILPLLKPKRRGYSEWH